MKRYLVLAVAVQLLALAAAGVVITRQGGALKRHADCVAAVAPEARAGADPRKLCDAAIAERWATAVQAETCDAALAARLAESRYGIANNCSAPVKRVHAQRDTALAERDAARDEAAKLRTDQAAALRRAETDALTRAERKLRAQAVVARAPRTPDGRVRCDAQCLRDRAGARPDEGG